MHLVSGAVLGGLGLLHGLVTGSSRGLGGRCGHNCLAFDGGQATAAGLASAAVVGALEPDVNRDTQLVPRCPPAPVEYVLLQ